MYWIKKSFIVSFILIMFTGCAGEIAGNLTKEAFGTLGAFDLDKKEPMFLETVNNEEFKEFILKKDLIKGLKKENILYLDNANNKYPSDPYSYKILLTKNSVYIIYTKNRRFLAILENLSYKNYKGFSYSIEQYTYKEWYMDTQIFANKVLQIIMKKIDKKWYKQIVGHIHRIKIKNRYNNIKKMKKIIDERVAYHKKHKIYEEVKIVTPIKKDKEEGFIDKLKNITNKILDNNISK